MRNANPTPVLFAFALMSIVSAKALTTVADHTDRMPAADTELLTLRTMTPIVLEDQQLPATFEADHLQSRKLILTAAAQVESSDVPRGAAERPVVRMSKPQRMADASPAPAAQPAAPTVVNTSDKEITFAADDGSTEKVYTAAPGARVTIDNCTAGCAATGPWGYSRTLKPGDVVETKGTSEVTAIAKTKEVKKTTAAPASTKSKIAKAGAAKHKTAKAKPAKEKTAKKYNPYFKGSFASLFTGIVR